jgi:hypothetical protein
MVIYFQQDGKREQVDELTNANTGEKRLKTYNKNPLILSKRKSSKVR